MKRRQILISSAALAAWLAVPGGLFPIGSARADKGEVFEAMVQLRVLSHGVWLEHVAVFEQITEFLIAF